jgi:putative ABC transport system substrate-binding protein
MAPRGSRRAFVTGLAGAATLAAAGTRVPRAAAQRVPRLGVLLYGLPGGAAPGERAMFDRLQELGWVEGRTLAVERRYAEGREDRIADIAAEIAALRVDVILAFGMDLAKAARAATTAVPIVMTGSEDPVKSGLVTSLARPGGNVTGSTYMSPQLAGKRLELLRETLPRVARIGVLLDPNHVDDYLADLQGPARALGVQLQVLEVHAPSDLDRAVALATRAGADALFVVPARLTVFHQRRIAQLAMEARLPSVSAYSEFPRAGGLMSYGADTTEMARRVTAPQVDRLLKGARPAELPIEQPTRFELVVNAKTAKSMALTLPPSLLLRADQVIQ